MDVVPLVHQRHKVEAGVFLFQGGKALGQVFADLGGGVVGLLGKGGDDAVFAVELGVNLGAVVGDEHGGHVLQPDGLYPLQPQVEQHQRPQLLLGAEGVAHRHHVLDAALIADVAGGHGKVLGRQQGGDGAHAQHTAHVGLALQILPGVLQGGKTLFDGGQGAVQLHFRLGQQRHRVQKAPHALGQLGADFVQFLVVVQGVGKAFHGLGSVGHGLLQGLQLGRKGGDAVRPLLGVNLTEIVGPVSGILRQGPQVGGGGGQIGAGGGAAVRRGAEFGQGIPCLFDGGHHAVADAVRRRFFAVGEGLLGGGELIFGAVQLLLGLVQLFRRRVVYRLGHAVQLFRVENYVELPVHRAADVHAGHAGDACQLLGEGLVHEVADLVDVLAVIADGGHHYGQHGGVDFHHVRGGHGVAPLAGQGGDFLLNVHRDGVHVHPFFKFQHHHGHAVVAGGGHLFDVLQRGHGLLHRPGHLLLHALGAGAGVSGDDNGIGEVHVGQQVGRHFDVRHHAQHDDGQHRHKDGQRLFHAECRHPHPLLSRFHNISV